MVNTTQSPAATGTAIQRAIDVPLDLLRLRWKALGHIVIADVDPRDRCEEFYGGPLICESIATRQIAGLIAELPVFVQAARRLIEMCTCDDGCPICLPARQAFAMADRAVKLTVAVPADIEGYDAAEMPRGVDRGAL